MFILPASYTGEKAQSNLYIIQCGNETRPFLIPRFYALDSHHGPSGLNLDGFIGDLWLTKWLWSWVLSKFL
jgi:hypothetical protein